MRPVHLILALCTAGLLGCGSPIEVPAPPTGAGVAAPVAAVLQQTYAAYQADRRNVQAAGHYCLALLANNVRDAALACMNAVVARAEDARPWRLRRALLNASTDPAAAIADLRAAAAQSVLNADELALLGSQLQAIGDAAAAVTEFKAAALSKPDRVSVRLALGRLLMTQGQLDASAEQLLAAAALAPSSGVLRAELERLVAQGALKGSALPAAVLPLSDEPFRLHAPAYEDVQELDRTQRGLQWLALRALSRRDLEGARQTLQQLFAHYPATLKDHLVSADVHMAAGQSGPALHVLDDAVKQFAQQVEVRLARADLHARLREPEQAEPDYRWALEHAERPEQRAAAMRGMARIVAGQGRLFPARTLVEGALLLTPRDPLLHRDLFRILADLKHYDEAQMHLDRAEALGFPPDPQARRQLALARQQAPASH